MITEYAHARDHLDDVIALVIAMLERHRRAPAATSEPELRQLAELDVDLARRAEIIAGRRERTPADRLPLDRVQRAFALSDSEATALMVLCALEVSSAARKAAAPFLEQRTASATIELVEALVYANAGTRSASVVELASDGRLFRHRLAIQGDPELPWLARSVRVAPRLLELAMGRVRLDIEVAKLATLIEEPRAGDHLLVEPALRSLVHEALEHGRIPFLVGPRGSGRTAMALGAAHALAAPVLVVRAGALPREPTALVEAIQSISREATLFGAVLVVCELHVLAGDVERSVPDAIPTVAATLSGHLGPLAITGERVAWPPGAARSVIAVELKPPGEADRITLWQRSLGAEAGTLAARAAERYRITGGVVEAAARTARERARARGQAVALEDLRAGVRTELDSDLSTLGKLVDWKQTWDDLVLSEDIMAELVEMISRIKHRRRVLDEWGFHRKVGKGVGVSALFSGPPGTGKTMVAGLIAAELELDLYQIDVSRMVSKWVGETEKNLAKLFDAASSGHAVLLFDEADSLFAKRTEVKSSNDRYANLEVNYLLQRMEAFDGITILTTNLEASVDEAFRRRLAFRIRFPLPEVEERVKLWRAMLPAEAAVVAGLDFNQLAQRFEMSGGYIRNAVLRAAYLAAADDLPIGMAHLQRAATAEYAAMGMIVYSQGL
ncbi:MAG: ATP-binding protein [Kofleriaceae bacterium]